MTKHLATILAQEFGLPGDDAAIKPIGNGHINTTLLLQAAGRAIVVQKLNTHVFPEPQKLVDNARLIEKHLAQKCAEGSYELEIIRHLPNREGKFLSFLDGEVWRALELIRDSYSEEVVQSAAQAKTAAGAFGRFAAALGDFDAGQLHTVIPDFHNLAMRFAAFKSKVVEDPKGRVAACREDVDFCLSQQTLVDELTKAMRELPLRPCHNDTKINNMLFDKSGTLARAVIDLDTCMPGYWMFDFGDMARAFCSPEAEDSTDLDKVHVRPDIFAATVEGYMAPLKDVLTEREKHSFWLGFKVMALMLGMRFLTDHLDGDNYFAIHRENHNLDRARNQLALYKDILANEAILKPMILAG